MKIIIIFSTLLPVAFGMGMLFQKLRSPALVETSTFTSESRHASASNVPSSNVPSSNVSSSNVSSSNAPSSSVSNAHQALRLIKSQVDLPGVCDCQAESVRSLGSSPANLNINGFQGSFREFLASSDRLSLNREQVDQLISKFSMTGEQLALFYQSVDDDITRDHIDLAVSQRSVQDKLVFADHLINDPDPDTRALAYLIFGDTHSSENNNIEKLVEASYGEGDSDATNAILEALVMSCGGALKSEIDLCVDRMAYYADSGDPDVSESTMELLTRMPPTSTTKQIFKDKLSSPNQEIQKQALNGLFNFETADERTLSIVKGIANDPSLSPHSRDLAVELLEHYSN